MTDDAVIVAGGALALAAPGLAGYALARWLRGAGRGAWPDWLAWGLPTLVSVAFWGGCWGWAASVRTEAGYDDGSAAMTQAVFAASVVVNAIAGVALSVWRRRGAGRATSRN